MTKNLEFNLCYQHKELLSLIENLGEDFLYQNHMIEKWSIHENLAHLSRYQEIFQDRIGEILHKDIPVFNRYKAENDPEFELWKKKPLTTIINEYERGRTELVELIHNLSPVQMKRKGIHPKLGRMEINEWVYFFLLHEGHHIYTIFWLIHEFKEL